MLLQILHYINTEPLFIVYWSCNKWLIDFTVVSAEKKVNINI